MDSPERLTPPDIGVKPPTPSRRYQILELRKTGLSYAEIGRRLGVTRERVRQIITGPKPRPEKPKAMLRTADVAQFLGVHINTVRRWSKNGILKAYRIGPRRDRRFRREDVEDLLKEESTRRSGDKCWSTGVGKL